MRTERYVFAYDLKDAGTLNNWNVPDCPRCGKPTMTGFKVIRDVPDRYIDLDGNICVREYKELTR